MKNLIKKFFRIDSWAGEKISARCMTGKSLIDQNVTEEIIPEYYSVKEAVFPFIKLSGVVRSSIAGFPGSDR
jgi:hypothetical protein